MGRDGSVPSTRVGNMIVVFPSCYYKEVLEYGSSSVRVFLVMALDYLAAGPINQPLIFFFRNARFGRICCLALLTIATSYFAPKAYHNIGPISGITWNCFTMRSIVFRPRCGQIGFARWKEWVWRCASN